MHSNRMWWDSVHIAKQLPRIGLLMLCVRACVRVCVRARVRVCVCACLRVGVSVC